MTFNNGRTITTNGYVKLNRPDHPLADRSGFVFEHRQVAFDAGLIGADANVHVHHKNHDKQDNRLENLEVLTPTEHAAEHGSQRRQFDRSEAVAMYAGGKTAGEVAGVFGVHPSSVVKALKKAGVTIRPPQLTGRPDIDRDELRRLLLSGVPANAVARQLGCSQQLVRTERDRSGIAPAPTGGQRGRKAPQTHCGRGHELVDGNLYFSATGRRQCRTCARNRNLTAARAS